jgi:uncharacterized protein YdeI (YjbR/CyaY-like superfamily)
LFQFGHQPIVFQIADDGRIQHMVTMAMEVDLLFEFVIVFAAGVNVHNGSGCRACLPVPALHRTQDGVLQVLVNEGEGSGWMRKNRLIIVWKSSRKKVDYGNEQQTIAPAPALLYTGNMKMTQTFTAPDRAAWRSWLVEHGTTETEVWLVYYKAGTGKSGISYNDSLEEALCFGWVDSIIQKIDEEKYARKFTPRKAGSKWSELNKHLVAKLVEAGRMTEVGLAKADFPLHEAQSSRPKRPELPLPDWLKAGLMTSTKAWENFSKLPPSHRRNYIGWISEAKKEETRQRRIHEAIRRLEKNETLGLK